MEYIESIHQIDNSELSEFEKKFNIEHPNIYVNDLHEGNVSYKNGQLVAIDSIGWVK